MSDLNYAIPFVLCDSRPCLTMEQCLNNPAVAKFVERFRSSFEFSAAWDAYFLKPYAMPKGYAEALRGEDDGLML